MVSTAGQGRTGLHSGSGAGRLGPPLRRSGSQIGVDSIDEPGTKEPAPGDLRIVQLFVNSLDIEEGIEQWGTPAALSGWLHRQGLTDSRVRLDQRDLERARAFRSMLRAMALANNGAPMPPNELTDLRRELARLRFVARAGVQGDLRLEPVT